MFVHNSKFRVSDLLMFFVFYPKLMFVNTTYRLGKQCIKTMCFDVGPVALDGGRPGQPLFVFSTSGGMKKRRAGVSRRAGHRQNNAADETAFPNFWRTTLRKINLIRCPCCGRRPPMLRVTGGGRRKQHQKSSTLKGGPTATTA